MEIIKSIKTHIEPVRVVLQNALVTFIEGAAVAWQLSGYKLDKIVLGAMIGGGLSAVYNVMVKPYLKHKGWIGGSK